MKQRTAFLIASGLTAFLLVSVGMLAGRLDFSNNATATAAPTLEATDATAAQALAVAAPLQLLASAEVTQPPSQPAMPPVTPMADIVATLTEREAQYRALLVEANSRLEEANQQLAQLEQQFQAAQAAQSASAPIAEAAAQPAQRPRVRPTPAQPQPAIQAALTPQRALEIALIAAPGAVAQRMPELVDFQGAVAYEVLLNAGTMYVDANSGAILYNSVAVQPPPQAYYHHDDDDDDHEKHEKKEKHEKEDKKRHKKEDKKKHKD